MNLDPTASHIPLNYLMVCKILSAGTLARKESGKSSVFIIK